MLTSSGLSHQLIDFFAHHSMKDLIWLTIGFAGQILFAMRFVIQWICTEKERKSVIPIAFWYFSIAGSAVLLAYAIYKQDLVFISGQLFGFVVYARNLYFVYSHAKQTATETISR